jgi:hypothetical protein
MSIVLVGSTSGSCTLQEQAVAGTTTLTLPTFNGTVGLLVSGTAVASTSGTSIDFTSIPAGVRRITVMFNGVSTSGTSFPLIQLGDSGGIENTGYTAVSGLLYGSTPATTNSTAGFVINSNLATNTHNGALVISLLGSNAWVCQGSVCGTVNANQSITVTGSKTLSDVLDRIRITTVNGTDTFDAGSINILYE